MTSPPLPLTLPPWIASLRGQAPEDMAFASGAALAYLHGVLAQPQDLLRHRLALRAAETCVGLTGRRESASALRDAVHFLRPEDSAGPAGAVYQSWLRAVERPISIKSLHRALPDVPPAQIADWLDRGTGAPVTRAAQVLAAVLQDAPRAESTALLLADAALAQALGWPLVPLLGMAIKRADLRQDLPLACHRAVVAAVAEAAPLAADLSRRLHLLDAVTPKLRAKAAPAAVAMFRARDAVAPTALPLPDRAARRLCDRLVALGALRELTGRDSFRLYGL